MDNSRMSNADMIQYCDEALAWEEFGPVDIFFFESVKKILLGQSSPVEQATVEIDTLGGLQRPIMAEELVSDYHNFADIYYENDVNNSGVKNNLLSEETAFQNEIFNDGFFETDLENVDSSEQDNDNSTGFTVQV